MTIRSVGSFFSSIEQGLTSIGYNIAPVSKSFTRRLSTPCSVLLVSFIRAQRSSPLRRGSVLPSDVTVLNRRPATESRSPKVQRLATLGVACTGVLTARTKCELHTNGRGRPHPISADPLHVAQPRRNRIPDGADPPANVAAPCMQLTVVPAAIAPDDDELRRVERRHESR
jgi:hypothetical protein